MTISAKAESQTFPDVETDGRPRAEAEAFLVPA